MKLKFIPIILLFVLSVSAQVKKPVVKPTPKPVTEAKPTQKVTLELVNGDSMTGWFVGGDTKSITLQISNSQVKVNLDEIAVLRIGEGLQTAKPIVKSESDKPTVGSKTRTVEELQEMSGGGTSIVVKYDEFKNSSIVLIKPLELSINYVGTLQITLGFQFDGKIYNGEPKLMSLVFISNTKEWKFLGNSSLILLADGERIKLGDATPSRDVRLGSVTETLFYIIKMPDLRKIADAKSVRFQIGSVEGELNPAHMLFITQFRQMADLSK